MRLPRKVETVFFISMAALTSWIATDALHVQKDSAHETAKAQYIWREVKSSIEKELSSWFKS
ncbi:hypothetical protein [Alicyclobacillus tolerans]|uniref:Uncharacterized protein n=1 Tax=Alicyclobacillus tolerans TaxID=90970 RepID=A0A1M6MH33_9BACL|nr:hypothetical protein [Alicyclobacillus montanus]SHJ82666.1 hypothetical protein SAMN05443507_10453 [Alicyclobacillus montanus]